MPKLTKYSSEHYQNFFEGDLSTTDTELYNAINLELQRQQEHIELIASENIVSKAVLDAQGSIMTNKYAEGYSSRRYYGGCEYVDIAENLAIERVTKLFDEISAKPISSKFLDIVETNFSIVSVSIGLFLRAINKDFDNFSLSKGVFLPFFFTTINSLY